MNPKIELTSAGLLVSSVETLDGFYLEGDNSITVLEFPTLQEVDGMFSVLNCAHLQSFLAPNLTHTEGSRYDLQVKDCPELSNVDLSAFLPTDYHITLFTGCALSQASVDHILARAVASPLFNHGTLNLSGGTSSAPSATGLVDKATLIARGVNVITN